MVYFKYKNKIYKGINLFVILIGLLIVIFTINTPETSSSHLDLNTLETSEIFKGFDWTNEFRGQTSTLGESVAEDTDGNLYLLARAIGERILVKYNSNGNLIWNKTLISIGSYMVIDRANNIYITGTNNSDIYLIKYDLDGNKEWMRSWDSGLSDTARDITLDLLGNIYITGQANYNTSVTRSGDLVVLKYNSSGYLHLNKTLGKNNLKDGAESVVIDSSGNIYVAGWLSDSGLKWELVKLNTTGDYQWDYTFLWGGSGSHVCWGVALDSADNVYLTGYTSLTGIPSSVGLIKLNSSGGYMWNKTWDSGLNAMGISIAIDSQDNIFIAGTTETGDPDNDYDALFLKYDTDGNQIWNTTWERVVEYFMTGYWDDSFYKIFVSSDNDVYLIGASEIGTNDRKATIAKFENSPPGPPSSFSLSTNTGTPDIDGLFDLIWSTSEGADNYSVYAFDNYITTINNSLTILSHQTGNSPYLISELKNGTYYYIVVAFNKFGNITSNCISVEVKLFPPDSFTLSTDANSPDEDGAFNLIWTDSLYADNYSVYAYSKFISEINSSLILLSSQTAISPYFISELTNGSYYYIIMAHNKFGNTISDSVEVVVKLQTSPSDISDKLPSISGYKYWIVLGSLCIVIVLILNKKSKLIP